MIQNINNTRVNVNPNMKKKRPNYKLRRIAAGLTVAGIIFTVSACYEKDKTSSFDYDQTSLVSLADQYEELFNVDFSKSEEILANQMAYYDITRDQYEEISDNKKASEIDKVDARMEYVAQSREIADLGLSAIKLKVKEALGLTNEEISIRAQFDKADGMHYLITVNKGNDTLYRFINNDIDNEIIDLINKISNLQGYEGTGENQVWSTEINDFKKLADNLYNDILQFLDNDYELKGDNLRSSKEKTR